MCSVDFVGIYCSCKIKILNKKKVSLNGSPFFLSVVLGIEFIQELEATLVDDFL